MSESKYLGRIWLVMAVAATGIVVVALSGELGAADAEDGALNTSLTQLGLLYVVALFVERALEVFIKAWRGAGRSKLESERDAIAEGDTHEGREAQQALDAYRAGTKRRALLLGLTIAILIAVSGVRTLDVAFEVAAGGIQAVVFQFADVLVTAGLIAGGSSLVHEVMTLITTFLGASRQNIRR